MTSYWNLLGRECKVGWGYNGATDQIIPFEGDPPNLQSSELISSEFQYIDSFRRLSTLSDLFIFKFVSFKSLSYLFRNKNISEFCTNS